MYHARKTASLPGTTAQLTNVATAYNGAGRNYAAYADGDTKDLFAFDGLHAYADKQVWGLLETKLRDLKASGATSLSALDAGCGPGTWLRRLVARASELGFSRIKARGFDIAEVQILAARRCARELSALPGVDLRFCCGDLLSTLPEDNASVDLTICLYSVLSHLPTRALPKVLGELARVTRGCFVGTVRAIGSTPTIFIDSVDKAAAFELDHAHDQCSIRLKNGWDIELPFHLFTAEELVTRIGRNFQVEDVRGIDIFHNRFAPDRRWNPANVEADAHLLAELAALEEAHAHDPEFMDRANHLLFVARKQTRSRFDGPLTPFDAGRLSP